MCDNKGIIIIIINHYLLESEADKGLELGVLRPLEGLVSGKNLVYSAQQHLKGGRYKKNMLLSHTHYYRVKFVV